MNKLTRRTWIQAAGASAGLTALTSADNLLAAGKGKSDSLPTQLYRSLSDSQKEKLCLPVDHPKRQYISNWWYIHPEHRIPASFTREQQEVIRTIFNSMHSAEYRDAVNNQVLIDQYGEEKNAPSAGFFGTPEDENFEFIFTGHHVTRRCNARFDKGHGFGGAPIFYGHYPHPVKNGRENFTETKEHPGNPYWYQGRIFNKFVQALDGRQRAMGLVSVEPRGEEPNAVIQIATGKRGLRTSELSADQKKLLLETMRGMMAMFREDDVKATVETIRKKGVINQLQVSWYGGQYDIGSDQVWDTWQIEGPDMVWYFRGVPHIHCYFHLKA
ncbi:MAG: DUF3500 domain-containing protein [Acidobacteria bacterium]|nr:DUF3500 domain-containing protein [Acidobacteriota bacterium]